MTNFADCARQASHHTVTTNGATCWDTTSSALVDLFGSIGVLREQTETSIAARFNRAFQEDALLATKMAFYARNVRGGLGERYTFRQILKTLANSNPEIVTKNMENIVLFGRADDLYALVGTPCEANMWDYIKTQFAADMEAYKQGKAISLLAKWLKSVNTSSEESRKLGRLTAKALGLSEAEYRKSLAKLRKYTNVVEVKLSAKEYDDINYAQVPSKAMNIYRNAFERRDTERFEEYKESLVKGETKINASTLYPYDLVSKVWRGQKDTIVEEQWKALPNYVEGDNNILVMADTSGSMDGRPMHTSVGLAIYFAERNKGAYHNLFMTFSSQPEMVELKGNTLAQKVTNAQSANWNMSTNFRKALERILEIAIQNKVPQKEMPVSLVVISDMQFDCANRSDYDWDFYTGMKKLFADNGYTVPNIVFWNCSDGCPDTFHATSKYEGVQLVSGQSASTFKNVIANIGLTPYEAMLKTLSDTMYDGITI